MKATISAIASIGLLAAAATPVSARAQDWGGSLAATSDYIVRGITRSDGDPSVQGDLHDSLGQHWFGGFSAATVRFGPDAPISAELGVYAGYRQALGDNWQAKLTATHYDYPGSRYRNQSRYDEIAIGTSWHERWFLSASVLPDASVDSTYGYSRNVAPYSSAPTYENATNRPAYALDTALHQPLLAGWSVNVGLGYYDLHQLTGSGYYYWNGGVACDFGRAQLDFAYVGASAAASSLYYDNRAGDHWTATLVWNFF